MATNALTSHQCSAVDINPSTFPGARPPGGIMPLDFAVGPYSPAAKTHFGGEPVFVRYSFFYD